jgi:hypothetical protein
MRAFGKVTLIMLVTVSGTTIAATPAQAAPQYFVEGSAFNGEEAIEAGLESGTSINLESTLTGGATIQILCGALKLLNAKIKEKNKSTEEGIVFEKCKVDTPATCKIQETLATNAVNDEVVDVGTEGVSTILNPNRAQL